MIFLFGFGHRTHTDFGPLEEEVCGHCREPHFRILSKIRYWITFFFIPTIPYKTIWVSRCTYCSGEIELKEFELDPLKEKSSVLQKAIDEDWSHEKLDEALAKFTHHEQASR